MMNKVFLVGRITRDPELRQNSNNTPYVFFTIAINRLPSPTGERQTDFISCVTWGKQAENLARFIRKGGLIGVDGTLQSRVITDQNQQQRTVMEVNCQNITFLESRTQTDNQQQPQYQGYNQGYNQAPQMPNNPNPYQAPAYNQGGYNQNYNRPNMNNAYNPNNQVRPEPANPFAQEAQSQYTVTDDDIPF